MSLCKFTSNLLFNYYLHVCVLKRKYCTYLRESTIILLATSRDTVIQLLLHHPSWYCVIDKDGPCIYTKESYSIYAS